MPPPTLREVLEAAKVGETSDWEFKSAKGGLPRSLWETYSAMANMEGGVILLGATERDEGIRLDGLTDAELAKVLKELWDNLNNRGKVSANLLTNNEVGPLPTGSAQLLASRVPRATRTQRPVYLGPTPFGNTFRRQHEGDYRCPDDEVRRMLADADPVSADQRILEGFGLEDLDTASITQYRQRFSASKPGHPWLAMETRDLLEKLGGWRRDRVSGQEGLAVAGLLMFGKDQAIRDPDARPNYHVDFREKLDPGVRWSDRLHPDGTWEANLFQFYQRLWPKLTRDLKVPFQLQGAMRKDETPVHEALREALVNALIHADYTAPGGIVIERHPDRFVMANPGTLLVGLEQLRRGGVSECRNKALQQMFQMIGGGERAGSGFDKIQSGWRSQHWRAPRLLTQFQPDRVTLDLPMISLIPKEALDALQAQLGETFQSLSEAEVQALATAHLEGEVSNVRLQELLADHPVEITRMLMGLCERGFLVSDNRRRWTRYRLATELPEPMPLFAGHEGKGGDSRHKDDRQLPTDSAQKRSDSEHLGSDSEHLGSDSEHLGRLLPEDWEHLKELAEPVASVGKASGSTVGATILRLCEGRFLQAGQLAQLLDRHPIAVRQRYLKPLVAAGRLRLRFPARPNRPDQAYTSGLSERGTSAAPGSQPG